MQQVAFNSDTLKPTKELSEGAGEAKASISTCSLTWTSPTNSSVIFLVACGSACVSCARASSNSTSWPPRAYCDTKFQRRSSVWSRKPNVTRVSPVRPRRPHQPARPAAGGIQVRRTQELPRSLWGGGAGESTASIGVCSLTRLGAIILSGRCGSKISAGTLVALGSTFI
jgi:hypothetical protein